MRVMHGRPAHGVGATVGKRVLGTLGAVALTAGLLSACDGGEEPPADSAATSSPSPEESTPSPEPSADEQEPEASASGPSSEPSGDGTDEGDDSGDGTAEPGEDEGDGASQGEGKPDKDGDKDPKEEEPEEPDYIEYGEVSNRVGKLQQRLKDLGYFMTSVDKAYGGETQQAIFALQKAGGLYRDGVVGDATQNAADDGVVPKAHTSSGKVLEIDVDRQLVLAVEDGKVVKVINASSGNGETYEAKGATYTAYTPRGSFAVFREVNGMHSSTLELGDMWRPKFFTGGIAVHGSASVPAFPASHGCVRVSNSAMDWIWDTWGAPSGTPVVVY
ncbi:L,D-transpeptidase family protein [Promicromonospora sp. CA-289599]|uniref:L,D-transpeptidase family protein n=1 Tax=Promicromonospora sp. CA-289599 TaxID=3240014 RepID=UPI003D8D3E75